MIVFGERRGNMSKEIYKIFLSSVFDTEFTTGFQAEREKLKEYLSNSSFMKVLSLDDNNASPLSPVERSLNSVFESDVVVLFLGKKYAGNNTYNISDIISKAGFCEEVYNKLNEVEDKSRAYSLTHLEYTVARKLDKKVLVYAVSCEETFYEEDATKAFFKELVHSHCLSCIENLKEIPGEVRKAKKGEGNTFIDNDKKNLYANILALFIKNNIFEDLIKNKDVELNTVTKTKLEKDNCSLKKIFLDLKYTSQEIEQKMENELINKNYIDIKYIYYMYDGYKAWNELIQKHEYPIYSSCKNLLTNFISQKIVKQKLEDTLHFIDLGSGTGQKDAVIINKFLKEKN